MDEELEEHSDPELAQPGQQAKPDVPIGGVPKGTSTARPAHCPPKRAALWSAGWYAEIGLSRVKREVGVVYDIARASRFSSSKLVSARGAKCRLVPPVAAELSTANMAMADGGRRPARLSQQRSTAERGCRAALAGQPRLLAEFDKLLQVNQRYAVIREEQARDFTLA
jgi:hypothetical protein